MEIQPAEHRDVDVDAVPHDILATWPVGTFLENIALLADGDFVVSVHNHRELHRVTPRGEHHRWVSLPASPAGVITNSSAVFVVGGEPGEGPHHLYRITDPTGDVIDLGPIPGTLFLNGFTAGPPGFGFAVDSITGAVHAIDLATGDSRVVLQHELLTKVSREPMLPGANGVERFGNSLYITNTDRALILRAVLDPTGTPRGELDVVAEHLRGDDLAVSDDGVLFITNHIHNTLIRFDPHTGERVAIAGPAQGMAGSTACVFGAEGADRASLFVTTTGGIVMPMNGVVGEAKLVRLHVGPAGTPGRPSDGERGTP